MKNLALFLLFLLWAFMLKAQNINLNIKLDTNIVKDTIYVDAIITNNNEKKIKICKHNYFESFSSIYDFWDFKISTENGVLLTQNIVDIHTSLDAILNKNNFITLKKGESYKIKFKINLNKLFIDVDDGKRLKPKEGNYTIQLIYKDSYKYHNTAQSNILYFTIKE